MKATCAAPTCDRPAFARGWCTKHYQRSKKGDPLAANRSDPIQVRFWAKVDFSNTDGCWIWHGALSAGYGVFAVEGRMRGAHRYAYELAKGPIPTGLHIDHLCFTTVCVNPAHLEAVTPAVNNSRIRTKPTGRPRKTPVAMPDCHVCGEPLTDLEQAYDSTRDHTSPWYLMLCHKHLDEGDQDALDQLVMSA